MKIEKNIAILSIIALALGIATILPIVHTALNTPQNIAYAFIPSPEGDGTYVAVPAPTVELNDDGTVTFLNDYPPDMVFKLVSGEEQGSFLLMPADEFYAIYGDNATAVDIPIYLPKP